MKYCIKCPITEKRAIAPEVYSLTFYSPEIAAEAKCGQFVNITAEGFFLRRPISINAFDSEKHTVTVVFEVRGKGTKAISQMREGELIDVLGPLGGNGFELLSPDKKAVIIGGGIGTPPLVPLARHYGENAVVITGFRSMSNVILQKELAEKGARVILCTDDGTAGRKGNTVEALCEILADFKPDIIYACGPMPMLRGVAKTGIENNIRTQVSLEERMGCGVGGCLVCACRTVKNGEEIFKHVCKDGPIFEAEEVFQ